MADVESGGADASSVSPQRLIQSSVRLKINDPTGASYGSGTIIDARQGEALVLTCGHIFRDSNGKGEILVDLLGPGAPEHLPGRLVSYDLKQDVALVSIRPGVAVGVAPVAPKGQRIARGDRVITVGCNNGGPATAIYSQINSLDKFLGPPNVQVAGAPVEGRSGGGLFTSEGLVIGVCNAADPADNEGLYAALASIHQQLDQAGLSAVYAARPAPSEPDASGRVVVPAMAENMPDAGADLAAQARQLAASGAATGAATGSMSSFERATLSELRTPHRRRRSDLHHSLVERRARPQRSDPARSRLARVPQPTVGRSPGPRRPAPDVARSARPACRGSAPAVEQYGTRRALVDGEPSHRGEGGALAIRSCAGRGRRAACATIGERAGCGSRRHLLVSSGRFEWGPDETVLRAPRRDIL